MTGTSWPYYGGDAGGMPYSPLIQVNPDNVSKLRVPWFFHSGDVSDGKHGKQRSGFETTPILVDGMLVFTTDFNRVMAVNPETGKLQWGYDPKIQRACERRAIAIGRGPRSDLPHNRVTMQALARLAHLVRVSPAPRDPSRSLRVALEFVLDLKRNVLRFRVDVASFT